MNQVEKEQDKKSERIAKGLTKSLAIVGLIALIAAAAWLSVQAFRVVPSTIVSLTKGGEGAAVTLSSLFRRGNTEQLSVILGKTVVNSGESFDLAINHTGGESNRYSVTYECREPALFTMQSSADAGVATTSCDTPVSLTLATGTLSVTPTTEGARYLDVYATVTSLDTNDQPTSVSDTALFTIVNESGATTSPTTKTTGTATPSKTVANTWTQGKQPTQQNQEPATSPVTYTPVRPVVTGPADLAVTIKATGVSLANNEFVPTTLIPTTYRGAVKFVVENKGGAASGPWGFSANLPIEGASSYKYTSPLQPSLKAGDKIEFVLGFDQVLEEKTGVISISIIPVDTSDNATNNTAQTTVTIKKE